jgi:hypothetical protein
VSSVKRSSAVLLALLALAAGACGDDPQDEARDRVDAYVERQQELMRGAQPRLTEANRVYMEFSRGELPSATAAREVADAGRALRGARDRLLALDAPPEARTLHGGVVRYLDLNVEVARETTLLARYGPAAASALRPLGRANRRLQARLGAAEGADAQARALESYTKALRAGLRRLRALRPPALVEPAHRDQVTQLARTRRLGGALRRALVAQDAAGVARLLARFRRAAAGRKPDRLAAAQARARYDRRLEAIDDAYTDVRQAEQRLDRSLR